MAVCPGKRNGFNCGYTVYRCRSCGSVGCDQSTEGRCTNQNFRAVKCLRCGRSTGRDPVR
jgi:hypothetical protein